MANPAEHTPRLSLSAKILLGMGLGIIAGFFGEETEPIGIVGQGFVQLLQMAILPFLMVSLMTGLGSLTYEEAIAMGKKAGGILVLLWLIALTVVAVLPLTFLSGHQRCFSAPP